MFRSVLRPSSGVSSRTLLNYYVSACLLRRIPVCGGMLSVCVYTCAVPLPVHVPDTDRYSARIHTQTTYRHKLECDEAGRLTRSN